MYFRLCDHYLTEDEYEYEYEDQENDLCIICLDHTIEKKVKENALFKNYKFQCNCNYTIHKDCFENWIQIKSKCPICNSFIEKEKIECCILFIPVPIYNTSIRLFFYKIEFTYTPNHFIFIRVILVYLLSFIHYFLLLIFFTFVFYLMEIFIPILVPTKKSIEN